MIRLLDVMSLMCIKLRRSPEEPDVSKDSCRGSVTRNCRDHKTEARVF